MKNPDYSIAEYLKNLSPEERELHKDLISECISRESELVKTIKEEEKDISKLTKGVSTIFYGLSKNVSLGVEAAKEIKDLQTDVYILDLIKNPESESGYQLDTPKKEKIH